MKTKSKSLISIILSIMMVLSMVIVAVPVNAATVEDSSVGDTTYYFWYSFGKPNIGGTGSDKWSKITMTSAGTSTYTATLDVSIGNSFYFSVNTNANDANSTSSTWSSKDDVQNNVTFTSDVEKSSFYPQEYGAKNSSGTNVNYYFPGFSLSSAQKLTFTFTPSKKVVVSTASSTPTTYSVSASGLPIEASMTFSKIQGGASATSFEPNSIVYVTVTPPEGQECTGITVNGATVSGTGNSYSFTMPSSDVTVSATFSSSSSDMTTYNKNETSGKTLLISYDENSPYRNWAHIWHKDEGSFIDGNSDNGEMTSVSSINGLYYIDITNSISNANANKLIYFIVKNDKGWNGTDKSGDIKPDSFKKGKQWYIVDTKNDNAEYTPLELDSLKYGAITGGNENTIKVVPAGGVPWLMNEKSGPATNYTLTVYSGEGTSGTKIVDSQTVAYNGEFSFEWTPNTTDTQQKLTFVLTDGIDTVSYTNTFDVTMPASTYSVTAADDLQDGASLSFAKADGTITDKYEADETVKVTVTTPEGYECTGITVSDGSEVTEVTEVTAGSVYSFQMPAQNVTISATFKVKIVVDSKWSLVGSFNDWVATENPMKNNNGTYTTSLYLPANSTGFEFKIKNNQAAAGEHAYYSIVDTTINDSNLGTAYILDNGESISTEANINLITTGGVYTFTWVEDTNKLTVTKGSTYTLTATGTIPETIGAGGELNITINASYTGNPVISYYKYTVKAGAKSVASGVQKTSSTYNCKTTLSTNSTITYFVKAYNANGELIGLTATGSKAVTVTVGNFKVDLRVDKTEVIEKETFTLTATVDPAGYAGTYKFYQSNDGESYTALGTASTASTKTVSISTKGKYYFKVEVTNKYDTTKTVESYRIEVDVYDSDSASESHKVKIYFKSASSFIYAPTLTLNDGTAKTMNKGNFIGNAYSGSLKFYWYELDVTFDSTKDNTITFKTGRTQVNASFTSRFLADEYYFAVDNLMSDRTVYNLTTANEAIRNFYHSPLNMVTMGDTSDGNLGFTNVNGQTVKMGSILTATVDVTGATVIQASFSIRSATVAQKIAAEIEEVSDTQYSLLDVNLDGNVDVRDATLMQKALVNV